MRIVIPFLTAVALATSAGAQTRLSITPARPAPGALVRVVLRDSTHGDTIVAVHGQMAGEPLHFSRSAPGAWTALGAVPVDAQGRVTARAEVERAGARGTVTAAVSVPKIEVATSKLEVDSNFSRPLDAETQARVARENARAREVGRRSHDTPRLWSAPFLRPRASVITSPFGSGRVFNGAVTSRHLGVDFRGAIGEPIKAANRGVVALVDTFFLAGTVVYIDHGAGVVTSYFHMSKPLVAEGDTVARGQEIGLVGATGRVTAPHLHWSARYGVLAVNPLDLITVAK